MDAAAYWAVYAGMERTVGLTTIEIKLNYLAPVSAGRLIAKGRSIKNGRTICLADAGIENEKGEIVGHGTSTLMVMDSLRIKDHDRMPPKFLK
jgi:uncharacterized protein (TIGR00369 family)